jgi:hypothetical protein
LGEKSFQLFSLFIILAIYIDEDDIDQELEQADFEWDSDEMITFLMPMPRCRG